MKKKVEKSTIMGWAAIAVPLIVAVVKLKRPDLDITSDGMIEAIGGAYDAIAYLVSIGAGVISVFFAKDKE